MAAQTLSVILNAALAPVLISGWITGTPLGVAGAGWASTISSAALLLALALMFPRVQTLMRHRLTPPDMPVWLRIVGVGLPATAEFLLMFVITGVVYWVIADYGAHAQAGFGIGVRVMQSIFLPAMAVAFAAAPIAGQNFGARDGARVRETFRVAATISVLLMLLMTAIAHWRPGAMLAPFTDDAGALAVAADYIRIVSWGFVASGVIFTCSSLFQGLGDTRPALLASASRLLTFALPVLWLHRQPQLQLSTVWMLSVGSVFAQMALSLWLLRAQFRRKLSP